MFADLGFFRAGRSAGRVRWSSIVSAGQAGDGKWVEGISRGGRCEAETDEQCVESDRIDRHPTRRPF